MLYCLPMFSKPDERSVTTSIYMTPDERDALAFLKSKLGEKTDAAVRRFAILELARSLGWRPAAARGLSKK